MITPAPPGGSGEPGATPPTDIIVQVNKTVASWGWGSQGAHWILVIICMAVTFWMFFPIPLLRITVPLLVFGAGFVSGFLDQYLIIIAGVLFAVKLVQGLLTGNLLGVDLGRMGRQGRDVGDSSPPARVPRQHWSLWRRGGKK